MPPAKKLSVEEMREIVAARENESLASLKKRFGIGLSKLKKILKEADASAAAKTDAALNPVELNKTSELLYQISYDVQDMKKHMATLLGFQESHFEDLQGPELEVEETKDGILENIEKTATPLKKKPTDLFALQMQ